MRKIFILALSAYMLCACENYLDVKTDKKLTIPDNLNDLRALLDHPDRNTYPNFGEGMADNYYLTDQAWAAISQPYARNTYIWDNTPEDDLGWSLYYRQVYNMNVVLELLENIDRLETEWDYIKGTALFLRSYALLEAAQLYTVPYDSETAHTALGLPLRTSSDIEITFPRATLQETYDRIAQDLLEAAPLLPDATVFPTRPTKASAYGLLARLYLITGNYRDASHFAGQCIQAFHGDLLDYNELDVNAAAPIPLFNSEVLFHAAQISVTISPSRARVDTLLYELYGEGDLRKQVFFGSTEEGSYQFRGNYTQNINQFFTGISLSEVYLIIMECEAREGNFDTAAMWLQTLREKRMESMAGPLLPFETEEEALAAILLERRKELAFRNRRWEDLRRLNLDVRFQTTLHRNLQGVSYTLPPNDPRYVVYIPDAAIDHSSIQQNER